MAGLAAPAGRADAGFRGLSGLPPRGKRKCRAT